MMELYNTTCFECSKLITHRYSTSFSLGIKAFAEPMRDPIYAIYGFVRYADEIVDTFHGFDKERLIADFKTQTFIAIQEQISLNPVIHCFQAVVNRYHIPKELIDAFFVSMEMDLTEQVYDQAAYEKYIYGSAEVIGLMCLMVFCKGDKTQYATLAPAASKLGAAFQKINFLRDIKSDFEERGRTYFPNIDFLNFNNQDKINIEQDIQADFDAGYKGILLLPNSSRLGVFIAYQYYIALFDKIKKLDANVIANKRIRVSDGHKFSLFLSSIIKNNFNALSNS
jgi:15-cis-phytoene synthase